MDMFTPHGGGSKHVKTYGCINVWIRWTAIPAITWGSLGARFLTAIWVIPFRDHGFLWGDLHMGPYNGGVSVGVSVQNLPVVVLLVGKSGISRSCMMTTPNILDNLVDRPTNRKWVITPVISGWTLLIPFISGVITHWLSGMSHQEYYPLY